MRLTLLHSLRDIDYKFTPDSMFFSGTDTHKHHAGDNYELQLNFFKAIQNDKCTVEKKARKLVIEIPKAESANWKWLLRDHKKLPYMRYDWTMDPQEEEDPRNERLAKNKKAGKKKTEKIDGLGTVEVGEDGMPADFDDVVDSNSEMQADGSKTFTLEDDLFKKEFKFGILAPIMQPITAVLIENLPRWLVPLAMTIALFIVLMPVSFLFSWLLGRVLPARKKKPKAKAVAQGDTGKQVLEGLVTSNFGEGAEPCREHMLWLWQTLKERDPRYSELKSRATEGARKRKRAPVPVPAPPRYPGAPR